MTHSLDNQLSDLLSVLSITESCTVECGALFGGTYRDIKDERGRGRGRGRDTGERWNQQRVAPHASIHGGVEQKRYMVLRGRGILQGGSFSGRHPTTKLSPVAGSET